MGLKHPDLIIYSSTFYHVLKDSLCHLKAATFGADLISSEREFHALTVEGKKDKKV